MQNVRLWQVLGMALLGAVTLVTVFAALFSNASATSDAKEKASSSPAWEFEQRPQRVVHRAVMFGDSYFNGWGTVKQQDALGAATARQLGYEPIIRGTGATGYITQRSADRKGGVAGSFLDQIREAPLSNSKVDLVVVNGGLADRASAPETFDAGMREMIREIRAQQPLARIVILGPPNLTPKVEASGMDQRQRDIATSEGVDYISFDQIMAADELRPLIDPADLTHPVPSAVPEIVDRFADRLREIGVIDYRTS